MVDGATSNFNFNVFNVFPIPIEEGWFERSLASFQSHCCRSSSMKSGVSNFSWSKSPFNRCMSLQKITKHLYKTSPGFEPTTFLIHDLITWQIRPLDHRGQPCLYRTLSLYNDQRRWNRFKSKKKIPAVAYICFLAWKAQ